MPTRPRLLTPEEKEQLARRLEQQLTGHPGVIFAYLHGSFVDEVRFRDLDVAVYLMPGVIDPRRLRDYEAEVAMELETQLRVPVDVRILNDAPLAFRHHVLKGRLLLVRDADLLDEFRARTWDEYFDFAPLARSYLREVLSE